jgi:hypothetical protein
LFTALVAAACLAPSTHAAKPSEPTIVRDVEYGEVLFWFYQKEYFPAIVRLLAARKRDRLEHHDAEAELLLGGLWLSYGHHVRAAEIFEHLLADSVDPELRDRTWFFLAKIRHQRGYLEEARRALANIEGSLPAALRDERRMLQAQIHIDAGEYDEAARLLEDWQGAGEWAAYAGYNLGVAMVRGGRVSDAAAVLADIGSRPAPGEEQSALRDKANLALSYAYLQAGEPIAARPLLQRIRLAGPFSNQALLGAGWADAETGDYRRALVPWMELRGRSMLDPAVQEALLAIPYAMARLDATSSAADHYQGAIDAYRQESRRLDMTIARIGRGGLIDDFLADDPLETTGWYYRVDALPESAETRYLYHVLATHEFQEALKNYRDLAYLARNLAERRNSVAVFRSMLDTRRLAFDQRLPRVATSLFAADTDALIDRKLELDARLNNIEESGDSLALATEREFELWGEISALERTPAADLPEAREARHKLRLLKGVLQWELDRDFKARLWKARRRVRETGEALVETERTRRSVDRTMREEPGVYANFDRRVIQLAPRIDALTAKVQAALARQRAFLQDVAISELRAQKERLDTYDIEARFALATIYDRSSTAGEASQ